ncbi:MAG: hypothetical protein OXI24_16315 [Candidatus Poribacteria bacterium]|nr:hypothetical protein [Candidatus Poribacteria bacterium]
MKNGFDKEHNLSLPSMDVKNLGFELSPRQSEIHRNLEAIGPEIAAFYLSGVRMLQNDDLESSSYLLAHTAREIEGGLRDVLSNAREKKKIQKQLRRKDLGGLNERIGHIASILAALGIDDLSVPLAQRWISVATRFHEFAHRHGAWEAPREKETFVPLWREFEEVLVELVGTHFNLLNRLDRILAYEEPTEGIIKTLPNLLKSKVRYAYFFNKLDSPAWLKHLKDAGWFDIESSPLVYEVPDETGAYAVSPWYALAYLEKVTNYTKDPPGDETVRTLAAIVNDMVTYINNNQEQAMHPSTVWQLVKIICALPTVWLEQQHMISMRWALRWGHQLLIESEIEQKLIPKLLNAEAKELTRALLKVMLYDYEMIAVMKKHGAAIVKLSDVRAMSIVLEHIQEMISQNASSFQMIQPIESDSSEDIPQSYSELLVSFTCSLFRLAEPDSITETIENLLQKSHTVFKQIALNVIKHHYSDLKQYFWEWRGNPLEETLLQPELYGLLQTNCQVFDESEIEQILRWIETEQYIGFAEDGETRSKQEAYRKREWLSALMETKNKKIVSAYHKYERINPAELERPGLLLWTVAWEGQTSPTTIEELSGMSNAQIAAMLNNFKEKRVSGPSVPTERALAEMFEEYVALNPQRLADELQPFQGVRNFYQYWILRGFLKAWNDKREFDWAKLLDFIHQLVSSERFWAEHHEPRYGGHSEWIFAAAELIETGTRDSTHAFDAQLLPLAEKILLLLVEKVELGPSTIQDLPTAVVNSDRGRVFLAMVNYALRVAHINEDGQQRQLSKAIKEDFTKRLDRSVEPSFEFSFVLGACLPNLLYFDKEWVTANINRIFPEQDAYHWHVTFSGYLLYSGQLHESVYLLLKKHGHYQKAITSDFCSQQIDARVLSQTPVVYLDSQQIDVTIDRVVREKLVSDIYLGWVEGFETLADKTSLIYQLVDSENPNLLSTLIHFFWKKRDNLPERLKTKVVPTWRALYESLSQKDDIEKYEEVLSGLSRWVALVDKIDAEVLKWLKMSTQHIRGLRDSAFFIEGLLPHATKTPTEVGDIYLGMLTHNIYPYHDQEHIQEIVRVLYRTEHTEVANRICNLYGEAGFDFLRSLYDENQN